MFSCELTHGFHEQSLTSARRQGPGPVAVQLTLEAGRPCHPEAPRTSEHGSAAVAGVVLGESQVRVEGGELGADDRLAARHWG